MSERFLTSELMSYEQGDKEMLQPSQEMVELGDGSRTRATTMIVGEMQRVELEVDPGFAEMGMDPNGLLIDQGRTKERWGRMAGKTPEEFLAGYPAGSWAVCPSNWGWQYGLVEISDDQLLADANDPTLDGTFSALCRRDGKWAAEDVELANGQLNTQGVEIGLSMPLMARDGQAANPASYITDFRLLADVRNYANFAPDVQMPAEFWLLLRKVLPSRPAEARRIARGDRMVIHEPDMLSDEELEKLQRYIADYGLDKYLHLDVRRGDPRFAVISPLPLIRIPVIGLGVTGDGELMITAVDGRQEGSAGMTLAELTNYMLSKGATDVGLGCAGGDVAMVQKTTAGFELANTPANRNSDGQAVTRPVPSVLVVPSS